MTAHIPPAGTKNLTPVALPVLTGGNFSLSWGIRKQRYAADTLLESPKLSRMVS